MSWTPPSDSEAGDWTSNLQILDDNQWRDFDYDRDQIAAGTKLRYLATFVRVPCPYTNREWRLIIVDESVFTESNTQTLYEPGNMSLVAGTQGETTWSRQFTVPSAITGVASKLVRVGIVDQKARQRKAKDPEKEKSPLGVSAPRPCEVG